MKRPVKVAGSCPAGHALERDAEIDPYGRPRLTWRGPCPTEGCGAYLIARRVKNRPSSAVPKQEPPPPTATSPAPLAHRAVRKVTAYRDAPTRAKPQRHSRAADRQPADVSTTAPVPAVATAKPAEQGQPGGPPELEQRPSGRYRRRFSFGGPDTRDNDGFTIPGIY